MVKTLIVAASDGESPSGSSSILPSNKKSAKDVDSGVTNSALISGSQVLTAYDTKVRPSFWRNCRTAISNSTESSEMDLHNRIHSVSRGITFELSGRWRSA